MRTAALVMVYNEPIFFPIWLGYYSRFFAAEDIYVIDHGSTDGSVDRDGFVRVHEPGGSFDRIWRGRLIERYQRRLLEAYDAVLFTDVDEIIAPDPQLGTLRDYLDGFDGEFVNCLGYEILHMKDSEPPIDPARPILEQRGWWYPNPGYNKPLLSTVPLRWVPGFHHLSDNRINVDRRLRLIHLHRVDFGICLDRHRSRGAHPASADDVAARRGYQNRIVDPEALERWFYGDSCFEELGVRINPEPIPEDWRSVL